MQTITKSDLPYKRIRDIAKDKQNLDFLDLQLNAGDITVTLGHYIFFIGILEDKVQEEIENTLEAIKYGLHIIAKDFSDRREYNSYKHGLRIIPALKNFTITSQEDKDIKLSWDLEDSMTFYSENKVGAIEFITKTFDTERDIKLTSFCSNVIWNIVTLRRARYFEDKKKMSVLFFDKEMIEKSQKRNVKIQDLKYKITKQDK